MADPNNPPPGECRQCWQHAHDKSIHRQLGRREDCQACVSHMYGNHPPAMIVPGRRWF